jgi:hypothetical protein
MAKDMVLDSWHFWHFLVGVPTYKLFHSIGKSSWLHSPSWKFETCACGMYTCSISIICALPCQTSFVQTKPMLLKGDLLGFWIPTHWNFETWPMFETKFELIVQKKMVNWCQYPKTYTCNIFNYMLIVINSILMRNVHAPSD